MKKRVKNVLSGLGTIALISSMTVGNAFGGTWNAEGGSWRYYQEGNRPAGKGWIQDGDSFYMTDENGMMKTGWYQDMEDSGRWYYLAPQQGGPQGAMTTGWIQDNGRWYFMDTRIGGPRGGMLTGWQWIDGKCYYLDPAQGGAAIVSGTTPDGFTVDASGAWVDGNGNPYYEAGKGISSTVAVDIRGNASGGSIVAGTGKTGGGKTSGGSGGSSSSGSTSIYNDDAWSDYRDTSVGRSANDFENGNYGMMDSDKRADVKDAIDEFKEEYLTAGMSDFEKEIMIIRWLVENCTYEKGENWENSTAYSCIVNGRAQCSGYADAFLQTAKACGLEARYVYNDYHAWNLVKIGGDWYHVDVTWEDPIGSNNYGFYNLRNMYINLEDSKIKSASFHHTWSPSTIKARGTDYGPKVVAQYLKDGTIDTSKGQSFSKEMDAFFNKVANSDGSNMITYSGVNSTADQIVKYLETAIDGKKDSFSFVVRYLSDYSANVTGDYSALLKVNDQIEDRVNEKINTKYAAVLVNPIRISLYIQPDADSRYYAHETGNLRYQEGQGKQVEYLIHFVDVDGNEVGTQSGVGEKGRKINLKFPEGYSWISNEAVNYQINQGSANYSGLSFTIKGSDPVDMNVRLRKKGTAGSNSTNGTTGSSGKTEGGGTINKPSSASPSSADRV